MYSPLGLVIFVAVERTFVAAAYEQTNVICNIACSKAAINRNALAIGKSFSG